MHCIQSFSLSTHSLSSSSSSSGLPQEIKKDVRRDGGQGGMVKSDLSNGRESPVSDPAVRPGRKGIDSGPALCRSSCCKRRSY